jgi:hypothetical protein
MGERWLKRRRVADVGVGHRWWSQARSRPTALVGDGRQAGWLKRRRVADTGVDHRWWSRACSRPAVPVGDGRRVVE